MLTNTMKSQTGSNLGFLTTIKTKNEPLFVKSGALKWVDERYLKPKSSPYIQKRPLQRKPFPQLLH